MRELPRAPESYDRAEEQRFREEVGSALRGIGNPKADYTIPDTSETSTGEPVRELTPTATLTELRDFIITLSNDLREKGII